MAADLDLEKHYTIAKQDPAYKAELDIF